MQPASIAYIEDDEKMVNEQILGNSSEISVLIVDDSLVFRRYLLDMFAEFINVKIIGEAKNGIEALERLLDVQPDVILLDMEMPLLDGMSALQYLMSHKPTPTIMLSSLTEEGTARAFDALKNGAIDCIAKDFISQKECLAERRQDFLSRVSQAADTTVRARESLASLLSHKKFAEAVEQKEQVIFCEECGTRQIVQIDPFAVLPSVECTYCGDLIEIATVTQDQFRSNNFVTVLGGGKGAAANLLEILPQLKPDMGGCIFAMLHENAEYVDAFARYLEAISLMKVIRVSDGVKIEGGHCYLFSEEDYMKIKPYSAQLTLQRESKKKIKSFEGGPLDWLIASVRASFKKKSSAILLSGHREDGRQGIASLIEDGCDVGVLDPKECYYKVLSEYILDALPQDEVISLSAIGEKIQKNHYKAKTC